MTIRTAAQAAEVARNTHTNQPGMCQAVTRGYYLAPAAGDRDGDGDFDAVDAWLAEPASARHFGDRHPRFGYPVSFGGGSRGHGHRAISFGDQDHDGEYLIRSTDFDTATKKYRAGVVGTGTIAEVERALGVHYLGWSETIDGALIPHEPPTTAPSTIEKPEEDPVFARARTVVARIKANLYNPTKHLVDLDDLETLIKLGHQPEAQAAKDLRDAIKAATTTFAAEVKW